VRPPAPLLVAPNRDKRFGWYRLYEDFCGHPKWLLVAERAGVELSRVEAIVQRMFQAASKARAEGNMGGFDLEVCAASARIPVEQVVAVYRVLGEMGFHQQGFIVDWAARNPRDKTATERQRAKRARDEAKRAVAMGIATHEQFQMLSVEEAAAMDRLRELDRLRRAAIERQRVEPPLPLPSTLVKVAS